MSRVHLAGMALLGVLTTACGDGGVAALNEQGSPPMSSPSPALPPPHRIDWDHPLGASVASTRVDAKAQGRLPFDPIVPTWAVPESAVYVSDPSRIPPEHAAAAFVYRFPTGRDFPTSGQVVMLQRRTDETEASFEEIARSNGADHFSVIEINGRPALLVEADGIGRVRLIRNGVVIDITGPATPPASVVKLAEAFG
jgi:hypothetical protein